MRVIQTSGEHVCDPQPDTDCNAGLRHPGCAENHERWHGLFEFDHLS